jgi:hypothetical protein
MIDMKVIFLIILAHSCDMVIVYKTPKLPIGSSLLKERRKGYASLYFYEVVGQLRVMQDISCYRLNVYVINLK